MDTSFHQQTPPTLDGLKKLVYEDMEKVNACAQDSLRTDVPLIAELASHLFKAGGKRIRPSLTLACAQLCNAQGDDHIPLATAIEFIHTATLLHDDVIDESTLRRGVETANEIWDNASSVLVGDFLFSRAFQLLIDNSSLPILKVVSQATTSLARGEVKQLTQKRSVDVTAEEYIQVITAKTASLFEAACRTGALSAQATPEQVDSLGHFGLFLGMAYQLTDDLLDYTAKQAILGKTIGDDFREGKVTLPVILAIEKADEEERYFWKRALEELNQTEDDLSSALEIMNNHGAMTEVYEGAEYYISKATKSLETFPDSPLKSALIETAEFCVKRCH